MTNQKGFTLIELMIVVAIIGILASVAIPQYALYIARTEFASGVSACDELKAAVGEYVSTKAEANFTVDDVETLRPDLAENGPEDYAGKYTLGCLLEDDGVITLVFTDDVSADLRGAEVNLNPVINAANRLERWDAVTDVAAKYVPETIRAAAAAAAAP